MDVRDLISLGTNMAMSSTTLAYIAASILSARRRDIHAHSHYASQAYSFTVASLAPRILGNALHYGAGVGRRDAFAGGELAFFVYTLGKLGHSYSRLRKYRAVVALVATGLTLASAGRWIIDQPGAAAAAAWANSRLSGWRVDPLDVVVAAVSILFQLASVVAAYYLVEPAAPTRPATAAAWWSEGRDRPAHCEAEGVDRQRRPEVLGGPEVAKGADADADVN